MLLSLRTDFRGDPCTVIPVDTRHQSACLRIAYISCTWQGNRVCLSLYQFGKTLQLSELVSADLYEAPSVCISTSRPSRPDLCHSAWLMASAATSAQTCQRVTASMWHVNRHPDQISAIGPGSWPALQRQQTSGLGVAASIWTEDRNLDTLSIWSAILSWPH